jgi:hypothetical protein
VPCSLANRPWEETERVERSGPWVGGLANRCGKPTSASSPGGDLRSPGFRMVPVRSTRNGCPHRVVHRKSSCARQELNLVFLPCRESVFPADPGRVSYRRRDLEPSATTL